MSDGPHLVETIEARKFRDRGKLTTWHKIWFGDPDKLPGEVHGFIKRASTATIAGLDKIAALADDPTKTTVVRHETGKKIADRTVGALLECKDSMTTAGRRMLSEANDAINEAFALNESRNAVYERIINWINTKAKEPDGPAKIREAMKQDPQIVTVLSNYPPYVFDLNEDISTKIAVEGYMHHTPEAAERMITGQAIVEAAKGYDRAISGVRASFYNPTIAGQAAKRVEA